MTIHRHWEENEQLLKHLEQVHFSFRSSLGKKSKTRKWAIWQLQGATLGLAHRAIKYQKAEEDMFVIDHMARLSFEFVNQVSYFANPNTKASAIQKWWKVYMPFRYSAKLDEINYTGFKRSDPRRNPDIHRTLKPLPEGIDFTDGEYSKQLNDILSLSNHPSYNLTRDLFETDGNQDKGYILYEFRNTLYASYSADIMVGMIVDNAARALHLGSYLFGDPISAKELLTSRPSVPRPHST